MKIDFQSKGYPTQHFCVSSSNRSLNACVFMSTQSLYWSRRLSEGRYNVPLRTTLVNSILQPRAEMIKK